MADEPPPAAPPAWLNTPATRAVMSALEEAGGADCARFVGGCVRNTVLGRPIDDIDIATVLTPDQVISALDDAGLRSVPTGVEHGTVTAISEGRPYEITTLRRDVSTDGRRAVVAFTHDWLEDARRRDFRLNALYMDAGGTIHDPLGHGVEDAKAGRIVFVGDPLTRIREDYLRILRFFRFQAWYGRGDPDPAAVSACKALKGMLSGRSAERTSKELLKLLAAEDPRSAAALMHGAGVLAAILPTAALDRFNALVGIERDKLYENDPELRLAALLPEDAAEVTRVAERLRLSNTQRDRLTAAVAREPRIVPWLRPREARRAVYRAGVRAFHDRVKLAWAAADRPKLAGQWRKLLALGESWSAPEFPLTGEDAIAAGLAQGPLVGQALKEVEDWWVDEDFPTDRALALAQLDRVVLALG
ncbi:MAG TPA: CCA tRNA nucleotidyltransferase [Caulobacteraceae bacterium]|nr:CCA tRNA nucleotidyltransferase [Caulobacteraceae bacterium]